MPVKHILIVLIALSLASFTSHAKTYKVYFLGGQSNMVGFGNNEDLPKELQKPQPQVRIFAGLPKMDEDPSAGDGHWIALQPGLGLNFDYKANNYAFSKRFGPEVTFGATMSKLAQQDNIAIVKYAWGGTGLVDGVSGYGSWDPTVKKLNQYDYFLKVITKAMQPQDIDGDGETDQLIPAGIVWMQGEADAFESKAAATAYFSNLTRMMQLIRAALRDNDLPVIIGRITDSKAGQQKTVMKYSDVVRQAQALFTEVDTCAALSTVTESLSYGKTDAWHYLSPGYIAMGKDFADQMFELQRRCAD